MKEDRLVVRKTEAGQLEVALQVYCYGLGYCDRYSAVADSVTQAIELMEKRIESEILRRREHLEELNFLPIEYDE